MMWKIYSREVCRSKTEVVDIVETDPPKRQFRVSNFGLDTHHDDILNRWVRRISKRSPNGLQSAVLMKFC